jgi:hypothetical protein
LPVAHAPHDPPQSVSLSVPFFTPSLQVAAWHTPPVHTPLWQSPPIPHFLFVVHLVAQVPPQSVSDSLPFFTVSLQVAALHVLVEVPVQTRLWQSEATRQAFPSLHAAQLGPPQSTSVSPVDASCTPLVQLAAWHVPFKQLAPETQSAVAPQLSPALHSEVPHASPQSTSPSPPFLTPSLHVGAAHFPAVHTPLSQSPAPEHALVGTHLGQLEPQSTSVSVPFLTLSLHVGA